MSKPKLSTDDYHFMMGVLSALDVILAADQPSMAAEIIRCNGAAELLNAARRSGYPFMRALKKVYRLERIQS